MHKRLYDLECMLLHETEAAILITVDGEHKAWLPKSVVEIERRERSNTVIVTAPEALLIDKELI